MSHSRHISEINVLQSVTISQTASLTIVPQKPLISETFSDLLSRWKLVTKHTPTIKTKKQITEEGKTAQQQKYRIYSVN